jgi:hypothetical protein
MSEMFETTKIVLLHNHKRSVVLIDYSPVMFNVRNQLLQENWIVNY